MAGRPPNVLLVPWFAQGHFSPVVQLAEVLASAGVVATLVFSARVHRRLTDDCCPKDVNIRTEVIEDGLPEEEEDPSHTPSPDELWASNRVMQAELEKLVATRLKNPPTCLICSTFCHWTRAVAQKLGIPRVELWSSLATMYCAGFFYHRLLEQGLLPFKGLRRDKTWITCIPGLPRILASDFPETLLPESQQGLDRVLQRVRETYAKAVESHRVLVNSIYELESEAFDALQASKVRAYAIGPLFLRTLSNTPLQYTARPSMYKEDITCLQWLDSKDTASTLYVAFGTESKFPKDDIQELALGLEASEHNFLWVIRPGSVLGESSLSDILPDGFQERTNQRGQVVSWVPQPSVLAHRAIAGFLSHCGWNSTMESMWLGVPIIAWPQRVDQGINKKMIEEHWKVGIALEKDEEGRVKRAAVERAVRALLQGKEGLRARKIAEEMKEVMLNATQRGGSSRMNLEMFIHDLFQASDTNVL